MPMMVALFLFVQVQGGGLAAVFHHQTGGRLCHSSPCFQKGPGEAEREGGPETT